MYIPESSELGEEIEGLHHLYQSQPVAKDKALFHLYSLLKLLLFFSCLFYFIFYLIIVFFIVGF